jgi:1-acyl-sn-glycerol-3-phosphate acyltransferase
MPIRFLISAIATAVLWLTGWQLIDETLVRKFTQHPKKIIVFPHTTYWDFPILATYALTQWSRYHQEKVYVVMRQDLVNGYFGWFFRAFNCLGATRGQNFVAHTREIFQDVQNYSILIAPEGTTRRAEWKSGYYYLSQVLACPIQVMGLDYHRHKIYIGNVVYPDKGLLATQELLKEEMATIPTLNPIQSVLPVPRNLPVSLTSGRWKFLLPIVIMLIGFSWGLNATLVAIFYFLSFLFLISA